MIVCFDVRSEKYSFVKVMESSTSVGHHRGALINNNGKLGSLTSGGFCGVSGRSRSFEMCVLEDPEKYEWSKHIYEIPPLWQNVVAQKTCCTLSE